MNFLEIIKDIQIDASWLDMDKINVESIDDL